MLEALPKELPPAEVYADQLAFNASNENAINWPESPVFTICWKVAVGSILEPDSPECLGAKREVRVVAFPLCNAVV
ncbi:MAG: hypothetical protein ABSE51_00075 [Terracidiphilus sp.]|jgi:hypothetical protein